jgi:hypothetical protein
MWISKFLLWHCVFILVWSVLCKFNRPFSKNKAGKIPAQMNARAKSLCHFLNSGPDGRNDRIAIALGELMSARPSRGSDLYWRFFHDPMGVWRWERVDSHGNVSACDRGFITYPQCLADAVWRTFGEDAPQSS